MLDKYYHTKDIYYTREKMLAYLHNELPDFEKRAFEKLLNEDPFLQDALAGLKMQTTKQNLKTFKKIEADIDIITGERKPQIITLHVRNIAVAAMLLVFLTATFLIINQLNKTEQQKIASIQAEKYPEPEQKNQLIDSILPNRSTNPGEQNNISTPAEQSGQATNEENISAPVMRSEETKTNKESFQREIVVQESDEVIFEDEALDDHIKETDAVSKKSFENTKQEKSTVQEGAAMPTTENASLYITVEQMPEFPGGEAALYTFLANNIKYPDEAKEQKVEGTVYVKFLVNKKGKISDVQIVKGIGAGCDTEAERVVKKMPDWNPGMQEGKTVDVYYTLPVKFQLQ